MNFYFFYQRAGKESTWDLALSTERAKINEEVKPAFSTALDLSGVPDDNDWAKVRYVGPLYFDFDADGDLDLVCEQFRLFLGKLTTEVSFSLDQARFYASGSKGFHVEIPQACFIAKPPVQGHVWLPYIYREMAQKLMVDTLDLNVYTGKRGRQWRTVNVKRENGCYKVPLTWEEAFEITPDTYRELIQAPRTVDEPAPPTIHPQFSMMFESAKDKVLQVMRGRKKRVEKANEFLDPYRKAKRHPPTIERMMAGEGLAQGVGFQAIAMQMAIYATSVGMGLDEFLRRCEGLCEKHVSDSWRYGSVDRRKAELTRMWEYMGENTLYDFEPGPLQRMLDPSVEAHDLGIIVPEQEQKAAPAPAPAKAPAEPGDEEPPAEPGDEDAPVVGMDVHGTFRRGVFHNTAGLFVKAQGEVKSLCRATFKEVITFHSLEDPEKSLGFEVETKVGGKSRRILFGLDSFKSSVNMKAALSSHLIPYQGNDAETSALFDIMIAKSESTGNRVYTYPREGLSVVHHPETAEPVMVYLTQDTYRCALAEDDPKYFKLRYNVQMALSSYAIDIHKAPGLDETHREAIRALLSFNRPEAVSSLVGWFVAAHFRSAYLATVKQFPVLHVFGEAGSGKTQTIQTLAHFHWYSRDLVSVKSAVANTDFALENAASTSSSAPLILDEYKPREMKTKGRHEKIKDIIKASYTANDIATKGTLNKGVVNGLSIVKMKATAPIVFMAEAMEVETAIVERVVAVPMSKNFITPPRRKAFQVLQRNPGAISAIGRSLVDLGPFLNFKRMGEEVDALNNEMLENQPRREDGSPLLADRIIFNRAVVAHGLITLRSLLARHFGSEFDEPLTQLIDVQRDLSGMSREIRSAAISEMSKFLNRIAALTMVQERPYSMVKNLDYYVDKDEGFVEIRMEKAYDAYRLWCAQIGEAPLFDQFEALASALRVFSPVIDLGCPASALRGVDLDNNELIVRFDVAKLIQSGCRTFRA